jgi:multicomponent Na+:H+ antiporter subunit D
MYVFGLDYLRNIFGEFNWIVFLPVITIFYSSLKALCTSNIKMILAYSTITQLSLCLLSAFMFTPKAMAAALMHMVAHSFAKISMFYAAGSFYSAKNTYVIHDLYDIWREMPRTSIVFVIAAFSLIGIPPFGGFISKFYIMLAAAKYAQYLVLVTILISSVLTATYLSRMMLFIFRKHSTKGEICRQNLEKNLPMSMHLSLYICTFVVVFYFIVQKLISQFLLPL